MLDRHRARPEGDPTCLLEGRAEGVGEARCARVGFFVVVLRRDANQVLEAELGVERIALGAIDGIGDRDHLQPAP